MLVPIQSVEVDFEKVDYCPDCGASMENNFGYILWCAACNYNLNPYQNEDKLNKLQRIYEKLGDRSGRASFNKVLDSESLEPSMSWFRISAFLVATLVHGFSIFCLAASIIILSHWNDHFLNKVFGPILLAISFVTRPRVHKLEKDEVILPRDEFPSLYGLVDDISDKAIIKKIDGIVIDSSFNASIATVGLRGKKILFLGLPLFSVLTAEERIAIIGHELGHNAHQDLTRSFYVGTALNTIANWWSILEPDRPLEYSGLLESIASLVMKVLSFIPYTLYFLLVHLLWQDKQRAEYYADLFGSRVAGSKASLSLMEKLLYADLYILTLSKAAIGHDKGQFLSKLKNAISSLPANEILRKKRVAELELSKLDVTHPPDAFRMAFLEKKWISEPLVRDSEEQNNQINAELSNLEEKIETELIGAYLSYLN